MLILGIIAVVVLFDIAYQLERIVEFINPISDYFHRKRYFEYITKEGEDE